MARMDTSLSPRAASRSAGSSTWEEEGLYDAEPGDGRADVRRRASAAERHRRAAHGPRDELGLAGRARPLAPDARVQRRSCSRATTTPASRPRTPSSRSSASEGPDAAGARPRGLRGARLGMARTRTGGRSCTSSAGMGASLDYRRERFTMDDGLRAGGDALLRPPLQARAGSTATTGSSTGARAARRRSPTSSSTTGGRRHALLRPLPARGRRRRHVTIATVRPATILGDVAVAVHPDDERYARRRRPRGRSCRSSSVACPSSPTSASSPSSAPAR